MKELTLAEAMEHEMSARGMDVSTIAKEAGISPFVIGKIVDKSERFNFRLVRDAFKKLGYELKVVAVKVNGNAQN